jgi:hypothetical protein
LTRGERRADRRILATSTKDKKRKNDETADSPIHLSALPFVTSALRRTNAKTAPQHYGEPTGKSATPICCAFAGTRFSAGFHCADVLERIKGRDAYGAAGGAPLSLSETRIPLDTIPEKRQHG